MFRTRSSDSLTNTFEKYFFTIKSIDSNNVFTADFFSPKQNQIVTFTLDSNSNLHLDDNKIIRDITNQVTELQYVEKSDQNTFENEFKNFYSKLIALRPLQNSHLRTEENYGLTQTINRENSSSRSSISSRCPSDSTCNSEKRRLSTKSNNNEIASSLQTSNSSAKLSSEETLTDKLSELKIPESSNDKDQISPNSIIYQPNEEFDLHQNNNDTDNNSDLSSTHDSVIPNIPLISIQKSQSDRSRTSSTSLITISPNSSNGKSQKLTRQFSGPILKNPQISTFAKKRGFGGRGPPSSLLKLSRNRSVTENDQISLDKQSSFSLVKTVPIKDYHKSFDFVEKPSKKLLQFNSLRNNNNNSSSEKRKSINSQSMYHLNTLSDVRENSLEKNDQVACNSLTTLPNLQKIRTACSYQSVMQVEMDNNVTQQWSRLVETTVQTQTQTQTFSSDMDIPEVVYKRDYDKLYKEHEELKQKYDQLKEKLKIFEESNNV